MHICRNSERITNKLSNRVHTVTKEKPAKTVLVDWLGQMEISMIEKKNSPHMLRIPKADDQILEQDPQGMGSIYFSLENHINLAQASQIPGRVVEMHSNSGFYQFQVS